MEEIEILAKLLGLSFRNRNIIKQAFIHRSYLNETKTIRESNERMEFLGDSILSFLVSRYLFLNFTNLPEGELTNLRSSVVKTQTLASIAKELSLGNFLHLSKGEEEGNGRNNPSLLADTFEAFLGAVYLDLGLKPVEQILEKLLFPRIHQIIKEKSYKDAKSILQEKVQEKTKIAPIYKVLHEEGPDHAKKFTIGVYIDNNLSGQGTGKNKQIAEQEAAKAALEKWEEK